MSVNSSTSTLKIYVLYALYYVHILPQNMFLRYPKASTFSGKHSESALWRKIYYSHLFQKCPVFYINETINIDS